MISYRFLTRAEEEMTEAALFYEAASSIDQPLPARFG